MAGSPPQLPASLPRRPAGLPPRPAPPTSCTSHARQHSHDSQRPYASEARSPPSTTRSAAPSSSSSSSVHGAAATSSGSGTAPRSRWDVTSAPTAAASAVNGHGSASPPSGPSRPANGLPAKPRAASFEGPHYTAKGSPHSGSSSRSGYVASTQPRAIPAGPSSSRAPISIKPSPRLPPREVPRDFLDGPATSRAPPNGVHAVATTSSAHPPPDPFFYKSLGTKDFRAEYDPETDPSPLKKGKEVVYRYDGEGVEAVEDPRRASSSQTAAKLKVVRENASKPLSVIVYAWDKNSTGPPPPPPPSAILVTGYPGSTTPEAIRAFFAAYGRVESLEARVDKQTGGSLGVCWVKFVDDVSRAQKAERAERRLSSTQQDGNKVALEAIAKGNGQRIGSAMVYSAAPGVKVQMDGTGALSKAAAEAEMERRHPQPTPSSAKPPVPSPSAPPALPSGPRPPPPPPPPSHPPPVPPHQLSPNLASPYAQPNGRTPHSHLPPTPAGPSNPRSSLPSGPKVVRNGSSAPNGLPPSQLPVRQPTSAPYGAQSFSNGPTPYPPATRPPSHRPHKRGAAPGVSEAIAHAVLAAKKRLAEKQAKLNGNGEEDMELDSDEERAIAADEAIVASTANGAEPDLRDKLFFHADGRVEPFRGLRRGRAAANAIAWQASRTVLVEKLASNGMPYLSISRTQFDEQRMDSKGKTPALKGDDLEAHFAAYDVDRTFADRAGWYITFASPGAAQKAFDTLHQQPFAGAPLDLTLCTSETVPTAPAPAPSPPPKPSTDYDTVMERLKMNAPPKVPEKKMTGWTDAELVDEAREIVIGDLMEAFRKDVRDRVVSGKVTEHLSAWEQGGIKLVAPGAAKEEPTEPGSPVKSLASLPSFSRKKGRQASGSSQQRPSISSSAHRRVSSEAPSDSPAFNVEPTDSESETQARLKSHKKHDKKYDKKNASHPRSKSSRVHLNYTSSEDEGAADSEDVELAFAPAESSRATSSLPLDPASASSTVPRAPPAVVNGGTSKPLAFSALTAAAAMAATPPPQARLPVGNGQPGESTDSSSGRLSLAFGGSIAGNAMFGDRATAPSSALLRRPSASPAVNGSVDDEETDVDPDIPRVAAQEAAFRKKRLTKKRAKQLAAEGRMEDPEMDGDVEDEPLTEKEEKQLQAAWEAKKSRALARKAAEKAAEARRPATTPDPFDKGIAADEEDLFYVKLALERFKAGQGLHPSPPPSDDEETRPTRRHATGAARTEGYYHVSVAEKLANRPPSAKAKVAYNEAGEPIGGRDSSGVAVSRLARANTRGLVRGMELHKKVMATDTDVLKFNQLRTRKKQLTFSRSGIEGYGLFAMEQILAGEMVIEYVGELIRQQVADRREKAYERQGIGSSYLFRVDEDLVVDATKKGNLGRLINHCCVPNCTAKIITINGVKKIVIYAKTNIEPDDEVTYDYHFAWEEEKIPCLCGHPLCRKYLN